MQHLACGVHIDGGLSVCLADGNQSINVPGGTYNACGVTEFGTLCPGYPEKYSMNGNPLYGFVMFLILVMYFIILLN